MILLVLRSTVWSLIFPGNMRLPGYRALLQNTVSCIGLFCIKDLQAVKDETPYGTGCRSLVRQIGILIWGGYDE